MNWSAVGSNSARKDVDSLNDPIGVDTSCGEGVDELLSDVIVLSHGISFILLSPNDNENSSDTLLEDSNSVEFDSTLFAEF